MKPEKHHYTLNHLEDGEVITMKKEKHRLLSKHVLMLSNEMSIRRDIMFELLKEIPPDKIGGVIEEILELLREEGYITRFAKNRKKPMNIGEEK